MANVRREAVRKLVGTGIALTAVQWFPQLARAQTLAPLDPADPTAKALGYTNDASKLAAGAEPTLKPGSKCANCLQYKGAAGSKNGPCSIFPGKSVEAAGWCRAWVAAAK